MPPISIRNPDSLQAIIAAVILLLPVIYVCFRIMFFCYAWHARRFCRRNGYKILKWRWGPAFDESGTKMEHYLFEIICRDVHGERKLVRLWIWLLGVRRVLSDDKCPPELLGEEHTEPNAER